MILPQEPHQNETLTEAETETETKLSEKRFLSVQIDYYLNNKNYYCKLPD